MKKVLLGAIFSMSVFHPARAMNSDVFQASILKPELHQTIEFLQIPCAMTTVVVQEKPYLVLGFDDGMIHVQSLNGEVCKKIDNEAPIQSLTTLTTIDGETFIITVDKEALIRVRSLDGSLLRSFFFETGNLFVKKRISEQIKAITAFQRRKAYNDEIHDNVTIIIVTDRNAYYCAACRRCARGGECTSSYWCSHWTDLYQDYSNCSDFNPLKHPSGESIDAVAATTLSDDTALIAFVVKKSKIALFRVYRNDDPSSEGCIIPDPEYGQISDISFVKVDGKNYLLSTYENNVCALQNVDDFLNGDGRHGCLTDKNAPIGRLCSASACSGYIALMFDKHFSFHSLYSAIEALNSGDKPRFQIKVESINPSYDCDESIYTKLLETEASVFLINVYRKVDKSFVEIYHLI